MALVATVFAATGFAFAASIPDSKGVIHGCFKNKGGNLRLVKGNKCKAKETAISWNQTGKRGLPGSAKAYAYVDPTACPSGVCTPTHAKNITAVRHDTPGRYCVTAAGFNQANSFQIAGVDYRTTAAPEGNASAMSDSKSLGCNQLGHTGEVEVFTQRIPGGPSPSSQSASPADDVGFWIVYL
jgi:hypothetical protein